MFCPEETIKGEIEHKIDNGDTLTISGWLFDDNNGVCPIRYKYDDCINSVEIIYRPDICKLYNRNSLILCGWKFEAPKNNQIELQIKTNNNWKTFRLIDTKNKNSDIQNERLDVLIDAVLSPGYIIFDDFNFEKELMLEKIQKIVNKKIKELYFGKSNKKYIGIFVSDSNTKFKSICLKKIVPENLKENTTDTFDILNCNKHRLIIYNSQQYILLNKIEEPFIKTFSFDTI